MTSWKRHWVRETTDGGELRFWGRRTARCAQGLYRTIPKVNRSVSLGTRDVSCKPISQSTNDSFHSSVGHHTPCPLECYCIESYILQCGASHHHTTRARRIYQPYHPPTRAESNSPYWWLCCKAVSRLQFGALGGLEGGVGTWGCGGLVGSVKDFCTPPPLLGVACENNAVARYQEFFSPPPSCKGGG